MKKIIDIPEEIVKDLKKMAIDTDKDLKNFIQDHLTLLVRGQKKEQVEQLRKHAVLPLCEGNCGMNYCDDNGCIERKRILVEPKDLPELGA